MKLAWIFLLAAAQSPTNAQLAREVATLKQKLAQQQVQIERLEHPAPKHHSKPVRVFLKALPVIDHLGSVASIAGVSVKSH